MEHPFGSTPGPGCSHKAGALGSTQPRCSHKGRSTWEHIAPTWVLPPKSPFWKHPGLKPSGPTWEHLGAPRPNLGAPRSARVHHRAPGRHMFTLGAPSCPSAQNFIFHFVGKSLANVSAVGSKNVTRGKRESTKNATFLNCLGRADLQGMGSLIWSVKVILH